MRPAGAVKRRGVAPKDRRAVAMFIALAAAAGVSCGEKPPVVTTGAPSPIPISVLADSSEATRLRVEPPGAPAGSGQEASAWLARVSLADVARAPAAGPPLPDALPEAPRSEPGPPPLEVDRGLKPPIPKSAAPLVLPAPGTRGSAPASVELDVLVDATGAVGDVAFAGGSDDPALVGAAVACARQMTFYPALQAGKPVAVWCRQRFDFGARPAPASPE